MVTPQSQGRFVAFRSRRRRFVPRAFQVSDEWKIHVCHETFMVPIDMSLAIQVRLAVSIYNFVVVSAQLCPCPPQD